MGREHVDIVVVLVNYKNEERTIKFVQEEVCKIKIPHRVVVVNNGATTESTQMLSNGLSASIIPADIDNIEIEENTCYIIENPENSGFAKANNLAAEFSRLHFSPRYFLFSNNDIRFIDADVCEKLVSTLKNKEDMGVIGPKVIGLDGEMQSPEPYIPFLHRYVWMYLCTPFVSLEWKRRYFKIDYPEKAKEGCHYRIMGSFFIMDANAFFDCGMMDPHTFLYAEEMILAERLKRIGKKVYYLPTVSVLHEHGATTTKHIHKQRLNTIQFESEVYFYTHYRNTSKFAVLVARIVRYFLCKLK